MDIPDDFFPFEPGDELRHLRDLLTSELSDVMGEYADPHFVGMGGSGIVFRAVYTPHSDVRAIKVPRFSLYTQAGDEPEPAIDPEVHALSKLSHPNITRLFASYKLVNGAGSCTVTEYIADARHLDEYAKHLCCSANCQSDDEHLRIGLQQLSVVVHDITAALVYMHGHGLIHFDLKPLNLLVSNSGVPYIADLGFAKDVEKYDPDEEVPVGFTFKYAHPRLLESALASKTWAKAHNTVRGRELTPHIDLFAFGRTLQETLRTLEREYGDHIHGFYPFNYLHIVSCLCLCGHNGTNGARKAIDTFVTDQALGIPASLFKAHSFNGFDAVTDVLARLIGRVRLEAQVPELDGWSRHTINVSDLGPTSFTPRVRALVNHPATKRLADEAQLGLIGTIFPTATHTRLQHTLGVFHAACQYVCALYYDPENPTFRILVTTSDICALLAASLVHDLGQTAIGHELEEVDSGAFSHVKIGLQILTEQAYVDDDGRTIAAIIQGKGTDCWGLSMDQVRRVLTKQGEKPIEHVLGDILDSNFDADKLDYLIRDSVESRVAYGCGIDAQRFLRTLTTSTRTIAGGRAKLLLAIKKKGAASAEAFGFARYQLFQSLYWHHTFRATKAMLTTAVTDCIGSLDAEGMFAVDAFRASYMYSVLGLPEESLDAQIPKQMRGKLLGAVRLSGLEFLQAVAEGKSALLIADLLARRYYKRLFEFPLGKLRASAAIELRDAFSGGRRKELQDRLDARLWETLVSSIQSASEQRESLVRDRVLEAVTKIRSEQFGFLIDLPLRGWTGSGNVSLFVQDYKRRYYRSEAAGSGSIEEAALWSKHLPEMMRDIACFRIYCEPGLHKILKRVMSADDVLAVVSDALPGIGFE